MRYCSAYFATCANFRRPNDEEPQKAVDAEGMDFVLTCIAAVAAYEDFTEENDPFGTHEMGFMDVLGKKVWWKIDLYDRAYEGGSENPTSLAETRRVLTILFPSDY